MPFARIDDTLDMYYEDDDFTDPWRSAETVVLHHGNAKNARLWYAWVPLLARQYRVVRAGGARFRTVDRAARGLRLVAEWLRHRPERPIGPPGTGPGSPHRRNRRRDDLTPVCIGVSGTAALGHHVHIAVQVCRQSHVSRLLQPRAG